ncbi:MAG: Uncharacterised protein [Flavobacteriales bacterium UBA4585]|nr:MAG: Uncharacterised protein [Flavobacteriales bacterium UBA4585]
MVIFAMDEDVQPHIDLRKLDQFWPADLHSLTLYTLDGRRLWSADPGNIPPLPHSANSLVILEVRWNNGHATRRKLFLP